VSQILTTSGADVARGSGFDVHTAVEGVIRPWRATIEPEISGFGGAHGGYLSAIALRAMAKVVTDPERVPRSLSLHLLAAVDAGRIGLHPHVQRSGGSMTEVSLRVAQGTATVGTALAAFGRARPSLQHAGAVMPDVPPPEQCDPLFSKPVAEAQAGYLVEHRPAAPPLPFAGADEARILVWMRLVEDRPVDAPLACMLADAAVPALFAALTEFVAMPSTEITVHFVEVPASARSPWVLADLRTVHAADGYAIEDGELWTPDGRLVLVARQLRRILGAA
jgi:acyl-CoA thioesterase